MTDVTTDAYLTGGCQCGQCRYRIEKRRIATLYACHCKECQRQAGSAFGMSMLMPSSALEITRGTLKSWQRPADSGEAVVCHFCPDCGTRIYHGASDLDDVVSLKPGTLDDTSWLRPVGHLWASRAQPWHGLQTGCLAYSQQPGTLDDLESAYAAADRCAAEES